MDDSGNAASYFSGIFSKGKNYFPDKDTFCQDHAGDIGRGYMASLHIDASHKHTLSGTIGTSGAAECRPENFTVRIWKRTA